MLRSLYIRDYALIETLEVSFTGGLNIITGETGAGKSILIGALKMILGERANSEVVRTGTKKAIIEGVFEETDDSAVNTLLDHYEIERQNELILRREISSKGSRAFINDSPATATALREIAALLIDLHGQHEHQSLLRVEGHADLLDTYGRLWPEREQYTQDYVDVSRLCRERDDLYKRESELREKKELVVFQIEEIDAVAPEIGEEERLEAEMRILENAERLHDVTAALTALLYDGDQAVYDVLVKARDDLDALRAIDEKLDDPFKEVHAAGITIQEVAQLLQEYNSNIDFNPERLAEIRDRLGRLHFLKMKYGGSIEAVIERRKEMGEIYDLAVDFQGALDRKEQEIREAQNRLSESARALSDSREEASANLEQAIIDELRTLGIPNARFEVFRKITEDAAGWITVDNGASETLRIVATPSGPEEVEFYISANLGEDVRPLAMVASGGEISRIMLALKAILAKNERLPILVFDEIDSGISGKIGQRVGNALAQLASSHQIIAITHLPQIAARGRTHFVVRKFEVDGRTKTAIAKLSPKEREHEIAALLSGDIISDASLESARELLQDPSSS